MNYDTLFVNPNGRTSRADYLPALITVAIALAFFAYMVTGRTAHFCMLVLMYPTFVLISRRIHDMGHSAVLVIVPLAITLLAFAVKLGYVTMGGSATGILPWLALAVTAAFALHGVRK